jgi:hypothetical protein
MRDAREKMMKAKFLFFASAVVLVALSPAWGQAKYPDWPYAKTYDSVVAAPGNNKLLFESDKLRLIEVTIPPGTTEPMNGQPYPAVYLYDRPLPEPALITDTPMDPASPLNGQGAGHGTAPPDTDGPSCDTMAPLAPHTVANHSGVAIHYWVVEFKRVDGTDMGEHWKEWYPWMVVPVPYNANLDASKLGPPFSKEFPYPFAFDSASAAPNNHRILYADAMIRLVEVTERGESQENLHGHPYRSVFINDIVNTPPPGGAPGQGRGPSTPTPLGKPGAYHKGEYGDYQLDPHAAPWLHGALGRPPAGMIAPSCNPAMPQAPHAHIQGGEVPGHFYRAEFFRPDWVTRLSTGN